MGTSILRQLKKDQQDLREVLSEEEGRVANAQTTILRLEGAIAYLDKFVKHLEKKPKES